MTYIHASVSRNPRGHGSVAPDKRHCRQWMSLLFCGFLPNPFLHDLSLWRTSHEFGKTDLYPLSLMSLRYAVCSTACGSIIGHCFGACNGNSRNVSKWCVYLVVRNSLHWQKKLLMARNFFRIFTENNPARGGRKIYNIPDVNWLRMINIEQAILLWSLSLKGSSLSPSHRKKSDLSESWVT